MAMAAGGDERTPLLGNAASPEHAFNDSSSVVYTSVTVDNNKNVNADQQNSGSYAHSVASRKMYFSVASCVLGTSFSYGFALGSLNTPAKVMKETYTAWYNASNGHPISSGELTFLWSATVGIYCFGGLLSGCVGGAIADRFGRKRTMLAMNIPHVIALLLMFSSIWCHRYEVIIAGRFLHGVYGGLATIICPLYLNEISPPQMRGKIGTVNQVVIVIALAIGQVVGLPQLLGTENKFYYILVMPLVTVVLHAAMMFACPESPSWLFLLKKDKQAARQALESLRDTTNMLAVDCEIEEFCKAERQAAAQPQVNFKDMFTTYRKRPLAVVCAAHCSQQLGGMNAVIFYSTIIFTHAGLPPTDAQYATLSLGFINLAMTFVSLALIERLGRRTLQLHGLGGGFISLCLLTTSLLIMEEPGVDWMSYLCIVFTATYIIFFASGPSPIPWFYTSELFDLASNKWAISIATAVNWTCNFVVGVGFPFMQEAIHDYAFVPFIVVIALCWAFLYFHAPETKGRSIMVITNYFKDIENRARRSAEENENCKHTQNVVAAST